MSILAITESCQAHLRSGALGWLPDLSLLLRGAFVSRCACDWTWSLFFTLVVCFICLTTVRVCWALRTARTRVTHTHQRVFPTQMGGLSCCRCSAYMLISLCSNWKECVCSSGCGPELHATSSVCLPWCPIRRDGSDIPHLRNINLTRAIH